MICFVTMHFLKKSSLLLMLSPAFSQKMLKALPTSTDYFLAFLFLQSIFLTHLPGRCSKKKHPASRHPEKNNKNTSHPPCFHHPPQPFIIPGGVFRCRNLTPKVTRLLGHPNMRSLDLQLHLQGGWIW